MLVDLDVLKQETELSRISDTRLKKRLRAIEKSIRKYTNNNFMDLKFRFYGTIENNQIIINAGSYLKIGDNIELSHCLNNDVFTISEIQDGNIVVEESELFDYDEVMVTKVVYPEDIQEGVIDMLKWDFGLRNKVGIKSETISRHSVTYFDMDKDNTLKGYPAEMLGFLDDYIKARF